jgi:DNA-directed RNA polymerase I subunit RPA2
MTQVFIPSIDGRKNICVQLDGRIIGWAYPSVAAQLAKSLRIWKTESKNNIPLDLEIGFVPESDGGQYSGLFIFSNRSRMMRPVKYLLNGKDDQVGSFEQVYMNVACLPEEIDATSTHVEHDPTNFLSILANLTPFSDFNQVRPLVSETVHRDSYPYTRVPGTFINVRYSDLSVWLFQSYLDTMPDG